MIYIEYMTKYLEEIDMEKIETEEEKIEINDSPEYEFLYQIEHAIDQGDTRIIEEAIVNYKDMIDISYINWGEKIKLEILEDEMDNMKM